MVLVGGLVYLYLRFSTAYSFVESLFVFLPWIQRYWMGGAEKTEHLAIEKIRQRHHETFNALIHESASILNQGD